MSAYIMSDDSTDLITTAALYMAIDKDEHLRGQDVSDMLRQTNLDSVNYRYRESEVLEPYMFTRVDLAPLRPAQLLQVRATMASYEYQSCEHPGWATSDAYKLMVNLGEWVDAKLTAAGWFKVHSRHGDEWMAMNTDAFVRDWDRSRGFPDMSEYTPERLAALAKAHQLMNNPNPNIRRII